MWIETKCITSIQCVGAPGLFLYYTSSICEAEMQKIEMKIEQKKHSECKPEQIEMVAARNRQNEKRRKKERKLNFNEKLDLIESLQNWIEFGAKRNYDWVSKCSAKIIEFSVYFVVVVYSIVVLVVVVTFVVCFVTERKKTESIATHLLSTNHVWGVRAALAQLKFSSSHLKLNCVEPELLQIMIRWNRFADARRWCDCVWHCVCIISQLSLTLTLSLISYLSFHKESVYFWLSWSINSVNFLFWFTISLMLTLTHIVISMSVFCACSEFSSFFLFICFRFGNFSHLMAVGVCYHCCYCCCRCFCVRLFNPS